MDTGDRKRGSRGLDTKLWIFSIPDTENVQGNSRVQNTARLCQLLGTYCTVIINGNIKCFTNTKENCVHSEFTPSSLWAVLKKRIKACTTGYSLHKQLSQLIPSDTWCLKTSKHVRSFTVHAGKLSSTPFKVSSKPQSCTACPNSVGLSTTEHVSQWYCGNQFKSCHKTKNNCDIQYTTHTDSAMNLDLLTVTVVFKSKINTGLLRRPIQFFSKLLTVVQEVISMVTFFSFLASRNFATFLRFHWHFSYSLNTSFKTARKKEINKIVIQMTEVGNLASWTVNRIYCTALPEL